MKFNKQIIIVLVLSSLLLSALGAAFYFYTQNNKAIKSNEKLRVIYVAVKDIKIDKKITKDDIKKTKIAKKYILNKPLLEKEIIGKYAKENIYKNESFIKEKISKEVSLDMKNSLMIDKFEFNSYNIAFKLFENPNYSLKKGDIINIISVYPSGIENPKLSHNSVQYVAKEIKVLGFLRNGKESDKAIKKIEQTRKVKKKTLKSMVDVKADELILDINNKVLLSLTDDYERGKLLWMIKTKKQPPMLTSKKITAKTNTTKRIKKKVTKKKITKRSYPIKEYKPKDSFDTIKATIHYADQQDATLTKNKRVKVSAAEQCKSSKLFLIGISNNVHLRTGPSNKHKITRIVYRNYIIAYTTKVNQNWYQTCDGYYVHRLEVNEISKKLALQKLGK